MPRDLTRSDGGNGHRRRQLTKRVKAEETHCALCGDPVDPTLKMTPGGHGKKCPGTPTTNPPGPCTGCQPHPLRGEVDEDLPRSRGGSPHDRSNTRLMHRKCNQLKGAMTLDEARTKLAGQQATKQHPRTPVHASAIW